VPLEGPPYEFRIDDSHAVIWKLPVRPRVGEIIEFYERRWRIEGPTEAKDPTAAAAFAVVPAAEDDTAESINRYRR